MKNSAKLITTAILLAMFPSTSQCMNNNIIINNNIRQNAGTIQTCLFKMSDSIMHIALHNKTMNYQTSNNNVNLLDCRYRISRMLHYLGLLSNDSFTCKKNLFFMNRNLNNMNNSNNNMNNSNDNINNSMNNNNIRQNVNTIQKCSKNMHDSVMNILDDYVCVCYQIDHNNVDREDCRKRIAQMISDIESLENDIVTCNKTLGFINQHLNNINNSNNNINNINHINNFNGRQNINNLNNINNNINNMLNNINNNINNMPNINSMNNLNNILNINPNINPMNNFNPIMQLNNNFNNININDNRSLKDLLHMNRTFSDILNAINNNENIDENINEFYDYLLGKASSDQIFGSLKLNNLETILQNNNESELNVINSILNMEIVRNKFSNYITSGEQQSINEEFNENRFGTVIGSRKNEFMDNYKSAMKSLVKKKLGIYQQAGMNDVDVAEYLNSLLNKLPEGNVKHDIMLKILSLFLALFHENDNAFNEVLNHHNLRNILHLDDTFSQMQKDIENDISNKRDMNNAESTKEFYNSLFGNDFKNFKIVLQQGTNEEYKIILDILQKPQIQNYISGENIKDKLNTKEKWLEEYNKCAKILNEIGTIYNSDIVNQNNKEIFQIVKDCFNRRMEIIEEQNHFNMINEE